MIVKIINNKKQQTNYWHGNFEAHTRGEGIDGKINNLYNHSETTEITTTTTFKTINGINIEKITYNAAEQNHDNDYKKHQLLNLQVLQGKTDHVFQTLAQSSYTEAVNDDNVL